VAPSRPRPAPLRVGGPGGLPGRITAEDVAIKDLGRCRLPSPVAAHLDERARGIVTCGGLCPGLDNVVRGLALELAHGYGVRKVLGFRYGYEGLISRFGHEPLALTPAAVSHIHHQGGTILGSSRGCQDPGGVVDNLEALAIDILFVVRGGEGEGTDKSAQEDTHTLHAARHPRPRAGGPHG
jgi:6-phosphofructokinase 1